MTRRLIVAVLALTLVPAFVAAVPRPSLPRLRPHDVPDTPSYVRHVEPALVGLRVRAREDAPSSARLGSERFATGLIFDARGYVVTVSYALLDAVRIEAQTRDGKSVDASLSGMDLESGLGIVKLEGAGPWPAATLGHSPDATIGELTGTVGVDEDNELVWLTSEVKAIRRFSGFWEYMIDRAFLVA